MLSLATLFDGKASQRWWKFEQLKRIGNVALFRKWDTDIEADGYTVYEVIIVQKQKEARKMMGGVEVLFKAKERYPNDNEFGTLGWSYPDLQHAHTRFLLEVGKAGIIEKDN